MELKDANLILNLCDRFKKLPHEIDEADGELLRYLYIQQRGTKQEKEGVDLDA